MGNAMDRRTFLKATGLTAAATLARPALGALPAGRKPNILLIMTDQQFADAMSCRIGKGFLNTPAFDALAAQGTSFQRAYSPNPICMPARTSLMTGCYPHQTRIQTNGGKGNKSLDAKPYAKIFKDAGYDTGYVGKWHIPKIFATPKDFDFQAFNKHQGIDRKIVEPIVGFMKEKRNKPFLAVASFSNPHNICEWARDGVKAKLRDGKIGTPPPLDKLPPLRPNHAVPEHETDAVLKMKKLYQSTKKFPVGNYTEKQWREYIWAYYRMVELVDGHIGELLRGLKDSGKEEDTLVVFLSDHGDAQGAHGWNQKTVFYDESSRVPFIIKFPGRVQSGKTSNRLVTTGIDLIPTLCDFAGLATPKGLPGLSLKDTAAGKTSDDPRKYVVSQDKFTTKGLKEIAGQKMAAGRMVRSERYKYCLYDMGEHRESLVDMVADPGEKLNLAYDSRHAAALKQHRQYYLEWREKHKDLDFPKPPTA